MPEDTPEKPANPTSSRLTWMRLLGVGLVALFVFLTFKFAPSLFPAPGQHVSLWHWAIVFAAGMAMVGFVAIPRAFIGRAEDGLSDEQIIARERRKVKIANIGGPIWAGGIVVLTAILFKYFPNKPTVGNYSGAVLLVSLFLVTIWLAPSLRAYTPRIQRKRMEEFSNYNRFGIAGTVLFAAVSCFFAMPYLPSYGKYVSAMFIAVLIVSSANTIYGYGWLRPRSNPARDDEWARQLRARVARIGYLTLMIGIGTTYLIALFAPIWLSLAIRSIFFAGIAIPASAYLILDWRAGG